MLNTEVFAAVWDAHGLYNSEQFVLRLSPKNHALLEKVTLGDFDPSNAGVDLLRAYSTYLHETIHWWQHVGSTSGLVLSMCYPLQIHDNLEHIKNWCSLGEASKSIKRAATEGEIAGITHSDPRQAAANVIINNTMDLQLFRMWLLHPERSEAIYKDPYFESQGHCFRIVYTSLLHHVCKLIDPKNQILPDPDQWAEHFDRMTRDRVMGYYYESPMFRRPIGVRELFEGQACYSQMQFLANSGVSNGNLNEFRQSGMLHGVYERAFDEYLKQTEMTPPISVNDPQVSLFLLICDLAINPVEGLLCEIPDFPNFVNHCDPGIRFVMLCKVVSSHKEDLIGLIQDHSRDEYVQLSTILSEAAGFIAPHVAWDNISNLSQNSSCFCELMEQHKYLKFPNDDVVLRVLLSHFLSFVLDKSAHPHFFCWPGVWKANTRDDESIKHLWLRNLSLFSDQEFDDGIFIRQKPGVSNDDLKNTLNGFFANVIMSNLTRQWVLNDGDFTFDFGWLSHNHDANYWKNLAEDGFKWLYGVSVSDIKVS
jgi:hypothetical protein